MNNTKYKKECLTNRKSISEAFLKIILGMKSNNTISAIRDRPPKPYKYTFWRKLGKKLRFS